MNLPVCAQVVGDSGRRVTTHPRVLAGFEKLFSLVAGSRFRVENPFVWDTKAGCHQADSETWLRGLGQWLSKESQLAH